MANLVEIVKQTNDGFVFDNKLLFNILDTIGDKNVSIVSIIGAKSTGKTFLLDYLLRFIKLKQSDKHCNYFANESVLNRFELSGDGSGDQTDANVISIWSEPLIMTTKDGEELAILLMETRCDFETITEDCGQIFALSLLLSSTLILNIKSDLTEDLLKFVEFYSNFAQTMNGELKLVLCQRFVFLLRDWSYERSNRFGCGDDLTEGFNDYIRSFCNSSVNQCLEEQNERKSLMTLINDMSCYLLPNPGSNVTKPGFCGQIDLIDRDFTVKVEEFVAIIINNIETKLIDGHKQTGNSFKQNLENWRQIMQNQEKNAKPLTTLLYETGLELAFINAGTMYETKIETCVESNPTDKELLNVHIIAEEETWNYFTAELNARVSDANANQVLDSLREKIALYFESCRLKNLQRIENETFNPGVARNDKRFEKYLEIPNNIVFLELPCPGSYNGLCDREDQYWLCEKCGEHLEYGFDEYFYCFCGKADVYGFEFKCNSKNHSKDYIQFTQNQLKELLSRKEINILILGETGVGKSTWINGFVNYLTYPSLTEATKHELLSLIACSFIITDNNYEERLISVGEDTNEVFTTGQSATQEPKSYVFNCESKLIRIIDTPGIGDTRGYEQDKENFDGILRFLSNLDKLHGICILLKPNNARLGVMFRFCIKELLTHLHRDASRNIVFCFTNSRSTFYRPGDTMPALKALLSENKEVDISLSKGTVYCMDNEPFRFLCALHHGIQFDDEDCDNYAKSWDKSVNETKRMLDYICGLNPHSVSNTLSLNDTRKIIVSLSKPLADITQNILTNINVVEDKKREIQSTKESEKDLKSKLYMDVIQLETIKLDHPRTVCTDQKCVKYHNIEGSNQYTTEFITHCHEKCRVPGVKPESYPNPQLKHCSALKGTGNCVTCECSWDKHMHFIYEQIPIVNKVRDEAVEELIKNKKTIREGIELQIKNMEQYVKELNDEKDMITKISAKFGGFLKANSIVAYNDALGEYLELLIRMEKDKVSAGGDRKTLDGLVEMKKSYDEEVILLDQFMANGGKEEQLSPIGIIELVDQLYALKHKGRELRKIMQVMSASKMEMYKFNETNCNVKNKEKLINARKQRGREMQQIMQDLSASNLEKQNIIYRGFNYVRNRFPWK